jgi:hypothetical protein
VHRGLERRRIRDRQVGPDGAYPRGQVLRVADDNPDVVTCGGGLAEQLPADTAGGREDRQLHLSLSGRADF